jgi:hypothetical protein
MAHTALESGNAVCDFMIASRFVEQYIGGLCRAKQRAVLPNKTSARG